MALKTNTGSVIDKDENPEYYVALDSEGKGYLAKRKSVKEEPIVEESVEEVKKVIKPKQKKKK